MAPLEFVLVLPIFVFMLALLFQVGGGLSRQAETVITARHAAWQQRLTPRRSREFDFRDTAGGRIEQTAEDRFLVTPAFSAFSRSSSQHLVFSDSWGHAGQEQRADEFNRSPNFELYPRLAGYAANNAVGSAVNVNQTAQELRKLQQSAGALRFDGADPLVLAGLAGASGDLTNVENRGRQIVQQEADQLKKRFEELEKLYEELNRQAEQAQNEIGNIGKQLADAVNPTTKASLNERVDKLKGAVTTAVSERLKVFQEMQSIQESLSSLGQSGL